MKLLFEWTFLIWIGHYSICKTILFQFTFCQINWVVGFFRKVSELYLAKERPGKWLNFTFLLQWSKEWKHLILIHNIKEDCKPCLILYFIIVREVAISASIAARGLKFWLQVVLSAPFATRCAEIRIREIWIFRKFFFRFFSLLWTSWDLRVTPRMVRYHLIRIRTGKSSFFEHPFFLFFRLLKLRTLTIWVSGPN